MEKDVGEWQFATYTNDELYLKGLKRCSKCGEIKSIREYTKNKIGNNGLRSACVVCCRNVNAIYRQNNREREKNRRLTYREQNKDKIKVYAKIYNNKNKEKNNERRRVYHKNNPEILKQVHKRNYEKHGDTLRLKSRLYQQNHPDIVKKRSKIYYIKNIDRLKQKSRVWRDDNPNKLRLYREKYMREMPDSYMIYMLKLKGFTPSLLSNYPESTKKSLIETQRLLIKTKRLCKTEQV